MPAVKQLLVRQLQQTDPKPPASRYVLCLSIFLSVILFSCKQENIYQATPYTFVSYTALGLSKSGLSKSVASSAGNYALRKGNFHYDEFYSATQNYFAHYNQKEGELTLKERPLTVAEAAQKQFFYQAPFLTNLIRLYLGQKKLWVVTFKAGRIKLHSKPLPHREGNTFQSIPFKTYSGAVILGNKKVTKALFEGSVLVESGTEIVRLKLRQKLLLLGENGRLKLRRLVVPEKSKKEWRYSEYFLSTNPSWVYLSYESREKNPPELAILKYAFREKKILQEKRFSLKGNATTKPFFSFHSITPQGQVLAVRYQAKKKTFIFQSYSLENSKAPNLITLKFPLNAYPAQLRLMFPQTEAESLDLIGFQIKKDGLQFQTWTLQMAK